LGSKLLVASLTNPLLLDFEYVQGSLGVPIGNPLQTLEKRGDRFQRRGESLVGVRLIPRKARLRLASGWPLSSTSGRAGETLDHTQTQVHRPMSRRAEVHVRTTPSEPRSVGQKKPLHVRPMSRTPPHPANPALPTLPGKKRAVQTDGKVHKFRVLRGVHPGVVTS